LGRETNNVIIGEVAKIKISRKIIAIDKQEKTDSKKY